MGTGPVVIACDGTASLVVSAPTLVSEEVSSILISMSVPLVRSAFLGEADDGNLGVTSTSMGGLGRSF